MAAAPPAYPPEGGSLVPVAERPRHLEHGGAVSRTNWLRFVPGTSPPGARG